MARSCWLTEMEIGRFRKRGGRRVIPEGGHRGLQNRASAIDRTAHGGWSMAHSWWVAEMAIGRFRKMGGRCGIPAGDHRSPKIAHPTSTTPPEAGGLLLTLGG